MAAKKTAATGSVKVRAYASPTLVLLALDWPKGKQHDDFLGFAIRRAPGYRAGEKDAYLWNKLSFAPPVEDSSPTPSDLAPIQKFLWWDSGITTEQRGKTFAYTVFPVLGTGPADLDLLEDEATTCKVVVPTIEDEDGIGTYFNRAVVSSQSFRSEFPGVADATTVTKTELQRAMEWLANGMQDAIPKFATNAPGLTGAIYHLTDKLWTMPALKKAKGNRAIAYMWKPGTDTVDKESIASLRSEGYVTTPRTKANIMHDKFLVRFKDGKPNAVLAGSANFTPEGITGQANVLHTFASPALAKLYDLRQQALAGDPTLASLGKDAGWSNPVKVGKASVRVFFSPESSSQRVSIDTVVQAVKKAKSSVVFCMFSPTDKALLEALMEAGDRKKVMFGMLNSIVDPTNALAKKNAKLVADGKEPTELTENAKVQVTLFNRSRTQRDVLAYDFFNPSTAPANFLPELSSIDTSRFSTVPPAPPSNDGKKPHSPPAVHIHHKFIVIDADTKRPTIYTGSANMSNNSVHRNDENLLEITGSPSLAQAYFAEFLRLYEHYRARAIWNQTHTKSGKPKPKAGGSKSSHDALVLKRTRDAWAKAAYTTGTREQRSRVTLAAPPT